MTTLAPSEPSRPGALELLRRGAADLPLLVVAILLLSTAADVLPPDNLVGVGEFQLNAARVLLVVGGVALLATQRIGPELFRTGAGLPLLLLLAVALYASHKWGTYPRYRFLVEGIAAFYLTFAVVRARADAREALAVVALVALAVAGLVAVAQVSQHVPTGWYRDGCRPVGPRTGPVPSGDVVRAVGTFANPNVLAGYLLLMAPVGALAGLLIARARGVWAAVLPVVTIGYLGVVFTFSRAAVLAALVSLAVGIFVSGSRQRRWLIPVVLALAVVAATLAGSCGSEAAAGYGRSQEWSDTLHVIRDNLAWGVGLGRLGPVLHARNSLSSAQHAHNLFLTWWAEAGTGAFVAWIWLYVLLLWRAVRGALSGDWLGRAGLVALLGFLGMSMLDHPANVDRVALAFWIVAGAAAASYVPAQPWWRWRPGEAPLPPEHEAAETAVARTGNVRVVGRGPRD